MVVGEVVVVGRVKDMIVIRGANLYPHDVEDTVRAAHPAVVGACAFAVADGEAERLVVVAEVGSDGGGDAADEVALSVRAAVVAEHDVALGDLVLAARGTLPTTSSGKIMRAETRRIYLDGVPEPVPDPADDRRGVRP